jgi:predicted transposase YbfD/YdcC
MEKFEACFSELSDPRAANAVHDLSEVLFVALSAVLCGAESCVDMADFGRAKEGLLRQVLRLEHGIPSHDTFSRVFRMLDPQGFEAAFRRFTAAFGRATRIKGVVAIDGKAVRGAFERGCQATPLHLVNVWAAEARLVVAQRTAPRRNEVAGVLDVLQLLSLDGCIVTADALHCRGDIAQAILDRGGHYVLALKQNRPTLWTAASQALATATRHDEATMQHAASHGRYERRHISVVRNTTLAKEHGFPGIRAVAQLTSHRQIQGQRPQVVVRFFVLSRPLSAKRLLNVIRQHWGIENRLHWVLDVVLNEDRARNRKDHGPENLAILRKLALNLLRTHPDPASLRRKIKRAGWDNTFLLSLLAHMR